MTATSGAAPVRESDVERERFTRLLSDLLDVYRPQGVLVWLGSPNRHLDGQTPRELIVSGTDDDWARLLNEADRMASR